jgi:hypothetical protein
MLLSLRQFNQLLPVYGSQPQRNFILPPPPESNYRGARVVLVRPVDIMHLVCRRGVRVELGVPMNVYGGPGNTAGVCGLKTVLGAPGMGGGVAQALSPS